MPTFKFFEVGGKVRDELMGLQSKDIDYVAVPDPMVLAANLDINTLFNLLVNHLKEEGFELFLVTAACFTIRAKFPKGHKHAGIVADFVMARKEIGYKPGTREPIIVPGTLYDDLERRDFTVNAIAKDEDGNLIDPFDGQIDLKFKILRTPLEVTKTLNDDPLRVLRAIRFCVTKNFDLAPELEDAIFNYQYDEKMKVVSEERIREELFKCFKSNSLLTIVTLWNYPKLLEYIFNNTKLWLKPTNEQ